MALGDPYASLGEVKARLKIADAVDDAVMTDILSAITREIEGWCDRQFNLDVAPTSRRYYATGLNSINPYMTAASPTTLVTRGWSDVVVVDEFTSTGFALATDEDDDGTFETVWTSQDYQLEPLDGIVSGVPGYPYSSIRAVGATKRFPISGREWTSRRRPAVQVTATFGFPVVPKDVHEAAVLLALETFKLKDAPFGVAGFSEYGAVRVRDNPKIASLLARYKCGGGIGAFA